MVKIYAQLDENNKVFAITKYLAHSFVEIETDDITLIGKVYSQETQTFDEKETEGD